jgi:Xaa-Pro aminopeptidase
MNVRIKKVCEKLAQENLDAFLVTTVSNVRYLSGYTGSNGLLVITPKESVFLTDFRYKDQSRKEVKGSKVIIGERDLYDDLPRLKSLKSQRIKLGFEAANLNFKTYKRLKAILPTALLIPTDDLVESILVRKDEEEIKQISLACRVADSVFAQILNLIQPGISEVDLGAELEYMIKKSGADGPAFETIVASGKRSSMPHARASKKIIKNGDPITLDFGAMVNGYVSDITRTVFVGKAPSRFKKVYDIVLRAQTKAIKSARPGLKGAELDKVARDVINKAGYGKYFGHGLGHGIGLLVHDYPKVSSKSKEVLKPNMVVTIEPGIYIPNWGGVRIEDDVLITRNGCKVLTRSEKSLIEI